MRIVMLTALGLFSAASCPTTAFAINYSSVDGNCNIVQQSVAVSDGSTQINVVDCLPKSIDKQFRVRYVWLNGLGVSYLAANYFDNNLTQLLGRNPIVYQSTIYSEIQNIIDKFSNRAPVDDPSSYKVDELMIVTQENNENDGDAGIKTSVPPSISKYIKYYNGDEEIVWPDMEALSDLIESDSWPNGWYMSYQNAQENSLDNMFDFVNNLDSSKANALGCVLLSKEITREDVNNYYTNLRELVESFKSGRFNWGYMPEIEADPQDNGKVKLSISRAAVKSIEYFTQYNWPQGFLHAQGGVSVSDCAGNRAGFTVTPKKLFVKVAVVESLSPALDIQGMRFAFDRGPELRAGTNSTSLYENEGGVVSLGYGDSVVVPLEIQLRDGLPVEQVVQDAGNDQTSLAREDTDIYNAIVLAPVDTFEAKLRNSNNEDVLVAKRKSSYDPVDDATDSSAVSDSASSDAYIFGQSFELKSVKIEGQWVSVRDAPASALVANEAGGGASCPFLFANDGQDTEIALGRVLVGAHSRSLSSTSVIKLPEHTRTVFLRELEPEVTFISRLALRSAGQERVLVKDRIIGPGEEIEIDIPITFERGDQFLVVTGYYQLIDTALASTGTSPSLGSGWRR
jgi:hypothetical protein